MDWRARFLTHRVQEELRWQRLHADPHTTEADVMQYLHDQCGWHDGHCRQAASEYCVMDCPFRPEDLAC